MIWVMNLISLNNIYSVIVIIHIHYNNLTVHRFNYEFNYMNTGIILYDYI